MGYKIVNVFNTAYEPEKSHGGQGFLSKVRPYESKDFHSGIDFIDFVEIPPGVSIGVHTHNENEEIYFIIEGTGLMTLGEKEYEVVAGDVISNPLHGTHGLVNNSNSTMKVYIFQVSLQREASI
ncbi:Cupin domain-containing protein [Paenibacillus sp. OK060]|uniref:cupin domain-containing protein n=1 Tax=Paenibacillus sp. OK060 TaxID=1881034 RepID=UPI00088502D2|nr:cupin domain-containing protein [Paenibacillus sp. OK060]SDM33137.1 Cupin domain-containing protein [Paenibacillus sp. OK060]